MHLLQSLSAEVVDSNPYSRLMALQKMKIVKNYEAIRAKTILASDSPLPCRPLVYVLAPIRACAAEA